jgi:hypothetical protein
MPCGCGNNLNTISKPDSEYMILGGKRRNTKKKQNKKKSNKKKSNKKKSMKRKKKRILGGSSLLGYNTTEPQHYVAKLVGEPLTSSDVFRQPISEVRNYTV